MDTLRLMKKFGLFISIWLSVHAILHIPLPTTVEHRCLLQCAEYILRLAYLYPVKAMSALGYEWQLFWQRVILYTAIRVVNPLFRPDSNLRVYSAVFNGVPVRIYEPKTVSSNGAIVFVHGGGFILFDCGAYEGMAREIAMISALPVVSIDYRLAPEAKFPGSLNDVLNATKYFIKNVAPFMHVDPTKVAIFGDSAGGNMATVVSRKIRDDPSVHNLKMQVLFYPLLQFVDLLTPSYQFYHKLYANSALLDPHSIAKVLIFLHGKPGSNYPIEAIMRNQHLHKERRKNQVSNFIRHDLLPDNYRTSVLMGESDLTDFEESSFTVDGMLIEDVFKLGHHQEHTDWADLQEFVLNPDVSPLLTDDLSDMPLTYIATAGVDILRDEGYLYGERLRQANVNVTYVHFNEGFHAMLNFHSIMPYAQGALENVVTFIRQGMLH